MLRSKITSAALSLMLCAGLTPAGQAQGKADLFAAGGQAKSLIVRITGEGIEGAGIIYHVESDRIFAVTAKHVVFQRGKQIQGLSVQLHQWPGEQFPLDVITERLHPQKDVAAFEINVAKLGLSLAQLKGAIPLEQLGDPDELDPGHELFTVGHAPADAWISPKDAVRLAGFDKGEKDGSIFDIEHRCPGGHSGGGVFDEQWRLVGMIFDNVDPFCRALRIDTVTSILHGWKKAISLTPKKKGEEPLKPALAQQITVAVMDFDNRSGKQLPDISGVAQDVTGSLLVELPRVVVVTRDRLNSVQKELSLTDTVKSTGGLTRLGKLLDVDAIVTGSISRYDVERRQVQLLKGANVQVDTYLMDVTLMVIDVDTGRVRFSRLFSVEHKDTYKQAAVAPRVPVDRASELLRELLDKAGQDLQKALMNLAAGLATGGQLVKIPVTSVPSGASVLVNNVYIGSTPLTLELEVGVQEITIDYPKHTLWRNRVKVEPGLKIEVNLVPGAH